MADKKQVQIPVKILDLLEQRKRVKIFVGCECILYKKVNGKLKSIKKLKQ